MAVWRADCESIDRKLARYLTQRWGGWGGGGGSRAASSPLPGAVPDHAWDRSAPVLVRGPCA